MKQWFSTHILSADNVFIEDTPPISNGEFYYGIGMLVFTLVALNIIFHGLPF